MNVEIPNREIQQIRRLSARKWRGWIWGGLALIAVCGVVGWLAFRPHAEPPARQGRRSGGGSMPVKTATAHLGDIRITLNALGTVTPLATVTVKTQISGNLTQIAFQEGQMVRAGDFLAQIDPRPYQLALAQNQGQLQRDAALLKDARINLERYRILVAQDSIAKQQYDTQDALVAQYVGIVATDQALVDTAKLNIAYCHIIAPITGRIGLRQVDAGNYVTASDANGIAVMTQTQPISAIFTLPEDSLPAVASHLHAGVKLPAIAFDRGQTAQLATGWLATMDNQIDTSTGTIKLRAQFANQDEGLFPNQFVNVQLLVDTLHDVIVAPSAAIQHGVPGDFVYLVSPEGKVAVHPVTLGPVSGESIAVTAGLQVGDVMVVEGADKLKDGAEVILPAPIPSQPGEAKPPKGEHHHKRDPQP